MKFLRFAPGTHGRARLRLRHELNVFEVLSNSRVRGIPSLERVDTFPDRAICAIYKFVTVKSFQNFSEELSSKTLTEKLGDILKFGQSVANTLSEAHISGVFRKHQSQFHSLKMATCLQEDYTLRRTAA